MNSSKIFLCATFLLVLGVSQIVGFYDGDMLVYNDKEGCPKIEQRPSVILRRMMGRWNLPYMSNNWATLMANSFHGKFMKSFSMGRPCVKVHVQPMPFGGSVANPNATIWLQTKCPHTGVEINMACSPEEDNKAKWHCTEQSAKNQGGDSILYIIGTDNKSWALVVQCIPFDGVNWAIFSKGKILEETVVQSILKEVGDLGFNLYNVVKTSPLECMKK